MPEFLQWFTSMENTKPFALVWFFSAFIAIVIYVYSSKRRSKRFESYKNIPFDDDDENSKK